MGIPKSANIVAQTAKKLYLVKFIKLYLVRSGGIFNPKWLKSKPLIFVRIAGHSRRNGLGGARPAASGTPT